MPSRLCTHERLIRTAQDAGFIQTSLRDFFDRARTDQLAASKFIVHRHDIDTDLRTTRKLFEMEKKYGVRASYYFRLSTLDFVLMRDIEDYGSEASYHFEEVASFAKKNKIRDPAVVRDRLPEIRNVFRRNFLWFEQQLGKKLRTVASHGDFANRRLKVNNTEILEDQQLREECGIECEAYDRSLLDHVDMYITDRPPPQYYWPSSPLNVVGMYRNIYLVTHPRQFETNWKENTKDNLLRFYEAVTW